MLGEIPHFGLYHGEPILLPSEKRESMTVDKLQEKYPFRYKIYLQEGDETEPVDGVSPEVIARRLQMLNNLDRYIITHGGRGRGRVLREKQLAVFRDTRDFLETGETEGYVEAPTGFGKTVLFSEVIRATGQRTLVVVPSRILVEQTYERLRQFNPTLDIGRYYSDRKERDRQVIITTYQSLVISCGGVRPEEIDLLILDEVHQSLTEARIEAVGCFTNPVKLGFTATPEYTRDKRVENLLNNQIHAVSLREAVETGLLCSFSVFLAETNVDLSNVSVDQDGDYNDKELEAAVNIYSRNKSAVELYRRLNEEHSGLSKAVTYCVSIRHAQEVARVFNEAGIPAAAIWSDQDKDERRRIIEAYGRGDIKVLTNVNVLTEGFDDPQAALCLNLRPTLSKVVAKQRGGRVLRLDPDNPQKHAIVVDYLDRNENKRTTQVTFAQVAEGAQIINPVTIDTGGTNTDGGSNGHGDKIFGDEKPFDLEGLHVITNSQEVLRVVKGLEAQQNESDLERLRETDFPLTIRNLIKTFKGNYYRDPKFVNTMNKVISDLKREHPDLFVIKSATKHTHIIEVCTDRVLLTQRMIEAGLELKMGRLKKGVRSRPYKPAKFNIIGKSELPLTQHNLIKMFRGKASKISESLQRVLPQMEEEYPGSIAGRRLARRNFFVKVITDPERYKSMFISKMLTEGVAVKEPEILTVQEGDFPINVVSMERMFRGHHSFIATLVARAKAEIEVERSECIISRYSSPTKIKTIDVITDQEMYQKFLDILIREGAKLKDLI